MVDSVSARRLLVLAVPDLAIVSGMVGTYLDHHSHVEDVRCQDIIDAGHGARVLACRLAQELDSDLRELYAHRIERREATHLMAGVFDGGAALRSAKTWLEWQRAQLMHDFYFHPDVTGMPRYEQLTHFGMHLAKLGKLLAEASRDTGRIDEFVRDRLPDVLCFGIKLATVVNHTLPEDPLEF